MILRDNNFTIIYKYLSIYKLLQIYKIYFNSFIFTLNILNILFSDCV